MVSKGDNSLPITVRSSMLWFGISTIIFIAAPHALHTLTSIPAPGGPIEHSLKPLDIHSSHAYRKVGYKDIIITLLRMYRTLAPRALRTKCVFDPSCSHCSELAFRQRGIFVGMKLTYKRLIRCKPGRGGFYFVNIKKLE